MKLVRLRAPQVKSKISYHFFALTCVSGWSVAYVFTRLALVHFSVYSLGFLRYAVASVVLAALMPVLKIRPPAPRDLWKFAASGATGFFLYMITFNKGAAIETSATSSIIIATAPVITAMLSGAVYKEKLKIFQWIAIVVEFAGLLILTLWDGVMSVGRGIPWLLSAALSVSVFNMQQRHLIKSYTGLQASIFSIFAGTLMLSVFTPAAIGELMTASPKYLFYLALLGIVPSALSYVTWSIAIERAQGVSKISNYMFVTPVLASVLGFFIASERPDLGTIIGGGTILFGIFIFNGGFQSKRN